MNVGDPNDPLSGLIREEDLVTHVKKIDLKPSHCSALVPLLFGIAIVTTSAILGSRRKLMTTDSDWKTIGTCGAGFLMFVGLFLTWLQSLGGLAGTQTILLNVFFVLTLSCAFASYYKYSTNNPLLGRRAAIAALVFSLPLLGLVPMGYPLGIIWIMIYVLALFATVFYSPTRKVAINTTTKALPTPLSPFGRQK